MDKRGVTEDLSNTKCHFFGILDDGRTGPCVSLMVRRAMCSKPQRAWQEAR